MSQTLVETAPPLARWHRVATPLVTIGALGLATLALHIRDPHQQNAWGVCPSALVGLSCPGCGGLRAVNDLTNGHVLEAASSNLALVVAMPFLVLALAVWTHDRWRGVHRRLPTTFTRPAGYVVITLLAAFTVLRNLPVGSWLAP